MSRLLDGCPTATNRPQLALLLFTMGLIRLLWSSPQSCGQKSLYVDHLMGVQLLQIVPSRPSCLLPQQSCAPWGSFVFYRAPSFSCGQNFGAHFKVILCRPFDVCPTAANRLQHALLLITTAVLCPMGLIWLLWSSPWFLW